MKVIYDGPFRENAVHFKGVTFIKGQPTEVSDDWYEQHGANVTIPKTKRKKKVSDDNSD